MFHYILVQAYYKNRDTAYKYMYMCLRYEFYKNNIILTMIKSGCSHTESLCPAVSSQDIWVDSHENRGLSWAVPDLALELLIQLNSILNLQTVPFKNKNKHNNYMY